MGTVSILICLVNFDMRLMGEGKTKKEKELQIFFIILKATAKKVLFWKETPEEVDRRR